MTHNRPRLQTLKPAIATLDTRTAMPPPKVANPFYLSTAWRALVAEVTAERGPLCQDPLCKRASRYASRVFADHVVELQDGGAPLDKGNILLRCGSCHTRKTLAVRAERQRA
ncbi:HNH endonuclease [Kaistia soli]|nr:HNH endonuclease [Kaistia soli]